MARVTRSKKIEVAEDHTALPFQTPSLDAPAEQREALAELPIAANTMPAMDEDTGVADELKGLKAAYRNAIGATKKGRKGKGKGKKKDYQESMAEPDENCQTENDSNPSTVLDPNCQQVHGNKGSVAYPIKVLAPIDPIGALDGATIEDNSKQTRTTRMRAAKIQADPFDREVDDLHSGEIADLKKEAAGKEEVVKSLQGDLPIKGKSLEEVEMACEDERSATLAGTAAEDSFIEQITCRSPAKPVSRIEDSVEALDRLEEALEALDQAALAEPIESSKQSRGKEPAEQATDITTAYPKVPMDKTKSAHSQNAAKQTKPGYASVRVKSTAPKQALVKKAASMTFKPANSRDVSTEGSGAAVTKTVAKKVPMKLSGQETVKSTKLLTRPAFELPGEAIARKLKEQREARRAQRETSEDSSRNGQVVPQQKVKSTKPATKPMFELPGEAISRRKKEAHEARLKVQEEEERKRREFKARPVRTSVLPSSVPRDTVASRARQSKIGVENFEGSNLTVSKKGANIGAHRTSLSQAAVANISAARAPASSAPLARKPSTSSSAPSASGRVIQRTVSVHEVQIQRQRAKEIYNRDTRLAEDIEREKKEREAAAKRSREEAAERGRQASREWAEKQRAKKMGDGDKGMSAGNSTGAQMGLEA